MQQRFFIVDDDPAVRRMLSEMLGDLGVVVGESASGEDALALLEECQPDIVLIDILMPDMDGIELVRRLRPQSEASLVMISQVQAKEMVGEAYDAGIDFFIHKPINSIEVRAVVERVVQARRLQSAMAHIARSVSDIAPPEGPGRRAVTTARAPKVRSILYEAGAGSESGTKDLEDAVLYILHVNQGSAFSLKEIFMHVAGLDVAAQKASEQRMRRAIQSSLRYLAALGLEDYGNPRFERYAAALFEFNEVRAEMRYLESSASTGGKISIKRYLAGVAHFADGKSAT
ncbi:MAG TPA: DNA-binding domain-containing protein [Bacillota bacterium]|nr:DNA-binding domain-containing protein [Bacillota bacterium]